MNGVGKLERYECELESGVGPLPSQLRDKAVMEPDPDGKWVLAEEAERLLAEARLAAAPEAEGHDVPVGGLEVPEEAVGAFVRSYVERRGKAVSADERRYLAADLQAAVPAIRKQERQRVREVLEEGLQFEIDVLRDYQREKGGMLGKLAGEIGDALTERRDMLIRILEDPDA